MAQRTTKLRCVIWSSREGLPIAKALQLGLDRFAELTVWTQGVIVPGVFTLTGVMDRIKRVDFALLVLTPDDLSERVSSPRKVFSPRDNVILELGMSLIELGPERTFIVHSREHDLDLPSDLAGIEPVTFEPHSDGNLQGAIGAACTVIETSMAKLGSRRPDATEARTQAHPPTSAATSAVDPPPAPSESTELQVDDAEAELLGVLADAETQCQDLDRSMLIERANLEPVRARFALEELRQKRLLEVTGGKVFEKVNLTHAGRRWLLSTTSSGATPKRDVQTRTFEFRVTNRANGKNTETLSLDEIMTAAGAAFLAISRGLSDGEIESAIGLFIGRRYGDMTGHLRLSIHDDDFARVKMHLISSGLIEEAPNQQHEEILLWTLTPRGRKLTLDASERVATR